MLNKSKKTKPKALKTPKHRNILHLQADMKTGAGVHKDKFSKGTQAKEVNESPYTEDDYRDSIKSHYVNGITESKLLKAAMADTPGGDRYLILTLIKEYLFIIELTKAWHEDY